MPQHRGVVGRGDVDKIGHPCRLTGKFLQDQLRHRAVDIGFAGRGHFLLVHHGHRSAGRAPVLGEHLRPATYREPLGTGVPLHIFEGAEHPERSIELLGIDLAEPGDLCLRRPLHRRDTTRVGGARTVEEFGQTDALDLHAGEPLEQRRVELAGIETVGMLTDHGDL